MQLPAFLHGQYRDVKAACGRMVTQLKRGVPWDELPAAMGSELIDTDDVPGLFVVDGPGQLTGGGDNFNLFAPALAMFDAVPRRLSRDIYVALFEPMIATVWGFLSLLGSPGHSFLFPPGHEQRMLHALVRWWDALPADDPRWSRGSNVGAALLGIPTNIQYCLVRQGLPEELCPPPLPPGGMAALVAQTRAGLPPTRDQLH